AQAQDLDIVPVPAKTPEDIVTERIKNAEHKNYLSLSLENDKFGGGSDKYYSSGVRLTYFNVNTPVPLFADEVADFIPSFDLNETPATVFALGQNIYPPERVDEAANQDDDR